MHESPVTQVDYCTCTQQVEDGHPSGRRDALAEGERKVRLVPHMTPMAITRAHEGLLFVSVESRAQMEHEIKASASVSF